MGFVTDNLRFTPEARAHRPQLAHMPFGWGQRSCIGKRFALLGVKIALIEILREYSFVQGPETVVCVQISFLCEIAFFVLLLLQGKLEQVHGIASTPKGGVYVKIEKRA